MFLNNSPPPPKKVKCCGYDPLGAIFRFIPADLGIIQRAVAGQVVNNQQFLTRQAKDSKEEDLAEPTLKMYGKCQISF